MSKKLSKKSLSNVILENHFSFKIEFKIQIKIKNFISLWYQTSWIELLTEEPMKLYLPDVANISRNTGYACSNATEFVFGRSLVFIWDFSFIDCKNLKTVNLLNCNQLISIGESAFQGCESLGSVYLPRSLQIIGTKAFTNCTSLSYINSEDNLEICTIKAFSFLNTNITSFTITKSINMIEHGAFSCCFNLKEFKIDDDHPLFIYTDGCLYSRDFAYLHFYLISNPRKIFTLPHSIISIGPGAFAFAQLDELTFNHEIVFIKDYAFFSSTIKRLSVKTNKILTIAPYAFCSCWNLKTADFSHSNGIKFIFDHAFENCTSLEAIYFPKYLMRFSSFVFHDCINLVKCFIPINCTITDIRNNCFLNCRKLTTFTISTFLESIGNKAFANTNLSCFILSPYNQQYTYVNSTLYDTKFDALVLFVFLAAPNVKVFQTSFKIKVLRDSCFFNAVSLEKIIIPQTVTMIMQDAISNTGIKTLILPKSLKVTSERCFSFNRQLEFVEFRSKVNRISVNCFIGCTHLKSVNFFGNPLLRKDIFLDCNEISCIYLGRKDPGMLNRQRTFPTRLYSAEKCPNPKRINIQII